MERNFQIHQYFYHDKPSWIVVNEFDAILCQGIRRFPFIQYDPILWKDYNECERWTKIGFIGDIQESFGNLDIGFQKEFLRKM
jgi:hypothetical protein